MADLTIAIDVLERERDTLQTNYDWTEARLADEQDTGLEDPETQQALWGAQIEALDAAVEVLRAGDSTDLRAMCLHLAHKARRSGDSSVPVVAIIGDAEKLLLFAQGRAQEDQP